MSYEHQWRLAMALRRSAPLLRETGDVMTTEANTSDQQLGAPGAGWKETVAAFADSVRSAKTLVIGTAALALVVGAAVGYQMGKRR